MRPTTRSHLDQLLADTARLLDSQFAAPLQVDQLARNSGIRAASFYEAFKQRYADTPLQYLTHRRMEHATALLAESRLTMVEIARAVGYEDEFYFSRVFKRQVGLAPTLYRRLIRRRVLVIGHSLYGQLKTLAMHGPETILLKLDRPQSFPPTDIPLSSPELDSVRAASPDLIICASTAMTDDLNDIAPTLSVCWHRVGWKEQLRQIGRFLGLEAVADIWLHRYERRVDIAAASTVGRRGGESVLTVQVGRSDLRVFGPRARKFGDALYGDLRLGAPASIREQAGVTISSIEELDDFGADRIICLANGPRAMARLDGLPWHKLHAAQRDAFHRLAHPAAFEYSARCHEWLLNQTLEGFA